MGRALLKNIVQLDWCELTAAIECRDSGLIGLDTGELLGTKSIGVNIEESLEELPQNIDVLIDFSTPEATLSNVRFCSDHSIPVVIGTTGFLFERRFQTFVF